MSLSQAHKKHYRTIAHHLKPVVMVAAKGLTDTVVEETARALFDHELIKVKFQVGDREVKKALINELVERTGAELVQTIGNTALLLKRNPEAKPHLSNLTRAD